MAYSRKVREAARRYWLLGYSDEKIIPLLKPDFPDEPTPNRPNTILAWRQAEHWEADLEIIAEKAQGFRREELASELGKMSERQLALLSLLDSHAQLMLTARVVKGTDGKPRDTELSASELSQVASALDRSIKNQRLIRGAPTVQAQIDATQDIEIDFNALSLDQIHRIADGEDPRVVLGLHQRGAK